MRQKRKRWLWILLTAALLAALVIFGVLYHIHEKQEDEKTEEKFQYVVEVGGAVPQGELDALRLVLHEALEGHAANWSVAVINLDSQQMLVCDNAGTAGLETIAASLIKLYIMATAYERIESGLLTDTDALEDDMYNMIVYSGNDAANAVLRAIGDGDSTLGMQRVNAWCQTQGYAATELNRPLGISAYSEENYTSAVDCSRLLASIYNGTCVSPQKSQKMLSLLQQQTVTYKIPAGIPQQTGVVIGNKTGELVGLAEHDVAIVIGDRFRYVLCVLCEYPTGETDVIGEISAISSLVYAHFAESAEPAKS